VAKRAAVDERRREKYADRVTAAVVVTNAWVEETRASATSVAQGNMSPVLVTARMIGAGAWLGGAKAVPPSALHHHFAMERGASATSASEQNEKRAVVAG